jgi:hypothetical protein
MPDLRSSIQSLAQTFAAGVLDAIRSSSLEDILGETSGRPPGSASKRLARRSANDIAAVTESIVALVKKHPKGLRAEQIRAQLGIAKKEWMRPLGLALDSKKLTKKGQKRATVYSAA